MLHRQLEVGPEPIEVGRARRWVRGQLAGAFPKPPAPQTDTLVLLVSELVTNAVVHTGRPALLRLALPRPDGDAGAVRLEVVDASSRPPRQRQADGDDTSGRGLELVDLLADRWGWQPDGPGKRIWCELDWPATGGTRGGERIQATR